MLVARFCRASAQEHGAPAPGEIQKRCLNRTGRAPAQDTAPRRQLVKKAKNTDFGTHSSSSSLLFSINLSSSSPP
ncbi:hypothetical protein A2U01_0060759 [Trifolium medium]|uniref:Uncharacterized protein n=1 Tax=Trifolium medium TaxID=97028 RepID=A0A392RTQ4_9FABA|nr:hypothetical protein [Trifolium medium]